jgi:ABC-type Mn2+/Zn2+ transport system permease subunit
VLILFTALFYRTLQYISFDENYARTFSRHVDLFKYISVGLTGLVIVLNIRMAGVIMIIALLTIPANIIMLFTRKYLRIIILSTLVSFISISAGFAVSWFTNLPTGATIVTVMVLFWLVARAARSLKRSSSIEKMKLAGAEAHKRI